jgi:dihydroorotate dehydrogenase (fumarate)
MDLATRYLGLELKHPIIASASPLTSTLDGIRTLEDAGAAAVVMASLFEEQVLAEDTAYAMYTEHGSYSQPETGTYFPVLPDYDHGVSGHLDTLRRAVEAVDIPVIASLNAMTTEGWVVYSAKLEQAGAAALELNVHFIPADPAMSSQDVEAHYVEIVRAVKRHGEDSCRAETVLPFQLDRAHGPRLGRCWCRWARPVQSLLSARR